MHFEPAVNTKRENKREMTINLPNHFWQKYLSESAGNGVSGRPGRKNLWGPPLVFILGFALGCTPRGQTRRGTVQRLDTLRLQRGKLEFEFKQLKEAT